MVKRRGVAATAVAAVTFSVLLVSGLVVFVASSERARSYAVADAEASSADGFVTAEGTGGASLLLKVQDFIAAQNLACDSAHESIAGAVGEISEVLHFENLTVSATASVAPGVSRIDNLSILAPFNGSVSGDLDMALHIAAKGASPWVNFDRSETHLLHLGLRIDPLIQDCLSSFTAISHALQQFRPPNCTSAWIGPLLQRATVGPALKAQSDGFRFGYSYSINDVKSCSVDFAVTMEQDSIQGIAGSFGGRLMEQGSVPIQLQP